MTTRFFHISFRFADGNPKIAELVPAFNKGLDWIRYAPNCWVVWSNSSSEVWYERLRPLISEADSMFIAAIDSEERQGWMSKSFWDWLNKDRSSKS
jgi:hypothetical protein